jgi:hypothetical protein
MLSVSDIIEIVDDESLSFAILEGVNPSRIKDPTLSELWEEAKDILIRIQEHLDLHCGEEEDEDDDSDWE